MKPNGNKTKGQIQIGKVSEICSIGSKFKKPHILTSEGKFDS